MNAAAPVAAVGTGGRAEFTCEDHVMPKRVLDRPPVVKQGTGYKCWAAALESWLVATPGRIRWTMDQLLGYADEIKTKNEAKQLPAGAINAYLFKTIANQEFLNLRMEYVERSREDGTLADNDLYQYMAYYGGYLYLVYTPANQIASDTRHAVVVWGADDIGNASIMDPQTGSYRNELSAHFGPPLVIGYKQPTLYAP
jgi:hypothetical protein